MYPKTLGEIFCVVWNSQVQQLFLSCRSRPLAWTTRQEHCLESWVCYTSQLRWQWAQLWRLQCECYWMLRPFWLPAPTRPFCHGKIELFVVFLTWTFSEPMGAPGRVVRLVWWSLSRSAGTRSWWSVRNWNNREAVHSRLHNGRNSTNHSQSQGLPPVPSVRTQRPIKVRDVWYRVLSRINFFPRSVVEWQSFLEICLQRNPPQIEAILALFFPRPLLATLITLQARQKLLRDSQLHFIFWFVGKRIAKLHLFVSVFVWTSFSSTQKFSGESHNPTLFSFSRITQKCLDQNLLPDAKTGEITHYMGEQNKDYSYTLQLPKDLKCTQCVLQWKYNAGKAKRWNILIWVSFFSQDTQKKRTCHAFSQGQSHREWRGCRSEHSHDAATAYIWVFGLAMRFSQQCISTGNSWGKDPETGEECVGCGPQEQFYGCADIAILEDGGNSPTSTTTRATTTTQRQTTVRWFSFLSVCALWESVHYDCPPLTKPLCWAIGIKRKMKDLRSVSIVRASFFTFYDSDFWENDDHFTTGTNYDCSPQFGRQQLCAHGHLERSFMSIVRSHCKPENESATQ